MTYPDAVYLTACDHITNGDLIETACKKAGCSVSGLRKWASRDEANVAVYARARLASAAALEEEALAVARSATAESYGADRLRVDTLKWAAAKRHPKGYGDRVDVDVTSGGAPLLSAEEREARVLAIVENARKRISARATITSDAPE